MAWIESEALKLWAYRNHESTLKEYFNLARKDNLSTPAQHIKDMWLGECRAYQSLIDHIEKCEFTAGAEEDESDIACDGDADVIYDIQVDFGDGKIHHILRSGDDEE